MFNIKIVFVIIISFLSAEVNGSKIKANHNDTLNGNGFEEDLFESLFTEAKLFYADAIISDLIGDTLDAMYQFDNVFKALAQLEQISETNELDILKYQQMLTAVIEYYDNKVLTIDHSKTGFSTAVFKEKLDNYIYSQNLEDLVNVEETIKLLKAISL